MRGWRSRFIFSLVVYFAGFATAIYCLAPVPEGHTDFDSERTFASSAFSSAFKSDEFAQSFNSGMHKALGMGKDVFGRTSEFIKQKIDEKRAEIRADK